ncbi:MAG: OmpA family protein [Tabrizicola sp.]|uniref:OmpA family protein n=1 Tax=Tabrizicola sp. TaxID=2005166 RepID=UPI001B78CE12|nr:OmpA family protein [Tabrizicola sp.]MCC6519303.1 OmpA family protein [Tabrizicola sp.]
MPKAIFLFPLLATLAQPVAALTLDLPAKVLGEESRSEIPGSYALPTAAFDGSSVPSRQMEGALDQRAFRLDARGMTTLALITPLRDQVLAAGYEIVFECDARACGGFDFRFHTDVMSEPDMHVDMGDFRFLSARSGDEAVSILVSRSAGAGYVQITRVSDAPLPVTQVETPITLEDEGTPRAVGEAQPSSAIAASLDEIGSAVLDDLVFASGAATLTDGDYPSLAAVAAWLQANPDGTIALVGHTDASGSLAANTALSERRAEAVAEVLIDRFAVDPARVEAKGVGFLAPRATNQTEEGRQKNRRVEVIVTSTR